MNAHLVAAKLSFAAMMITIVAFFYFGNQQREKQVIAEQKQIVSLLLAIRDVALNKFPLEKLAEGELAQFSPEASEEVDTLYSSYLQSFLPDGKDGPNTEQFRAELDARFGKEDNRFIFSRGSFSYQ